MNNQAKLIIASLSDNIGLARVTVASFASQLDFRLSELEELKVVVSEAVSNSIIHAYKEEKGNIEIEMELEEDKLKLIIKDQGCGIDDIKSACEPSYTTAERMGLGLTFIDSFMDEFKIESTLGHGTILEMIKTPLTKNKADKEG